MALPMELQHQKIAQNLLLEPTHHINLREISARHLVPTLIDMMTQIQQHSILISINTHVESHLNVMIGRIRCVVDAGCPTKR